MSTLVITHNAVDITAQVKTDSVSIIDAINSERDNLSFIVEKLPSDTFVPLLNTDVIVTLDGTRIFGGKLINYKSQVVEPPTLEYSIECSDYTHNADRSLITERYINQTAEDIIADLFTTYLPDFTYTNVVAPQLIARVSFNRLTMSQALDKLAKLGNFSWYIDYFKDLHFFAQSGEIAPISLTDTSDNYIPTSLIVRKDISQLRNKIVVEGGEVPTAARTTTWVGNGTQKEYPTNFKFAEKPTVTVNGVAQTVGVEFLDTAGFNCYWSYQQKYVRFETAPPSTHPVAMTGQPLVPIVAKVPLPTSIATYGQYEFPITDLSIKSQELAVERAIAELEAWADANAEAEFATYTAGLRSGQTININSALHGINEDFVIQRVEFTPYPNGSEQAGVWRATLQSTATLTLIKLLQKLLLDEKLEDDELQTLLTYLEFNENATAGDTIDSITAKTEPYNWDDTGVDWGYFKWA